MRTRLCTRKWLYQFCLLQLVSWTTTNVVRERRNEDRELTTYEAPNHPNIRYVQRNIKLSCPINWKLNGLNCYRHYHVRRSWPQALSICSRYGGQLAKIWTVDDNQFVHNLARDDLGGKAEKFWIGLFYRPLQNQTTKFQWSDGEPVSQYVGFWQIGQPDLSVGSCVAASKGEKFQDVDGSSWTITVCNDLLSFVCQIVACVEGTMFCRNGKCINEALKCDGFNDCGDMSDEIGCPVPISQCTRYTRESSGVLESPNFPNNYASNLNCHWTIEGEVNTRISLHFDSFETEPYHDIVTIIDGGPAENTTVVLDHLSGKIKPSQYNYISSTSHLTITFHTDNQVNMKGFKMTWKTVIYDCGGKLKATNNVNTLTSTNYPQEYPNGAECLWTIEANRGQLISLFIKDIELENNKDFLIIYDGDLSAAKMLFISSDRLKTPQLVISTEDRVSVYFFSNYQKSFKGFALIYQQGCNNVLQESGGHILSPGNNIIDYQGSHVCTYTINPKQVAMPPNPVTLRVNQIYGTPNKFLQIFDGMDSRGITVFPQSNSLQTGTTFTSDTGSFYLVFRPTPLDVKSQWNITYSLNCPTLEFSSNIKLSSTDTSLGSKVNISCPPGQELVNGLGKTVVIECLLGGLWSLNIIPKCQPVMCPSTLSMVNSMLTNVMNTSFQSQISVKCLRGHTFENEMEMETVQCTEEGSWSTVPTCQANVCDQLPPFQNGNRSLIRGNGQSYGTLYSYECFDGSYLEGPKLIVCDIDGWSSEEPICRRSICAIPTTTTTEHVVVNGGTKKIYSGDSVQVECRRGFKLAGDSNITCQTNQQFTVYPKCEDIDECANAATTDCSEETTACVNTHGGYTCQCKEGYKPKMECNSTSFLLKESNIPTVFLMTTGETLEHPVNEIANTGWCGSRKEPGANSVTITLDDPKIVESIKIGKIAEVANAAVTEISLKFAYQRGDPLQEYVNSDGKRTLISTADANILLVPFEAQVVKVTVENFKGSPCMTMDLIGCRRNFCTDIDECMDDNGGCDHLCMNLPGGHECACKPGYELVTKEEQTILQDTHPNDSTRFGKSCTPKQCPSLPAVDNGFLITMADTFFYPTAVEVICKFGYQLTGSNFVQCMSDGQWNATLPQCLPARCENFENRTSIGMYIQPESAWIEFGENVSVSCLDDVRPNHPTNFGHFRQCVYSPESGASDYRLAGNPPTCELVDCGEPEFHPGSVYKNFNDGDNFHYGSSFLFTCRKPFFVAGSSNSGDHIIRCTADGTWDFGDIRCDGTVCPDPGILPDGQVNIDSLEEGNLATFTCNKPGYEPYPNLPIKCVLGSKCPVSEELGISSGFIPDTAFAANTETSLPGYEPHKSRMTRSGWCGIPDAFMFLSVDLQHVHTLTTLRIAGIAGSGSIRGHVTKLQLFYKSVFTDNFDTYFEEFEMPAGNHNQMHVLPLKEFIRARYLLLGILEFDQNPCLRFDVLGCSMPLFENPEIHSEFTLGWNSSVPVCRDNEAPKFINCPTEIYYVPVDQNGQLMPSNFEIPIAEDNSGSIAWTKVEPADIRLPQVFKEDTNITYTAFDEAGNWNSCVVKIRLPDIQPPTLICPDSHVVQVDAGVPSVHLTFNQSTIDLIIKDTSPIIGVNFEPSEVTLALHEHINIKVTAEDSFGNEATCRFQIMVDTARCDENSLRTPPGVKKICNSPRKWTSVCLLECMDGYQFLDQGKMKTEFRCEGENGQWTPSSVVPACVPIADEPARYQLKVGISYPVPHIVSQECLQSYQNEITQMQEQIDNVLSQRCSASVQAFVRIVNSAFAYSNQKVITNITIQILPTVLDEVFYNLCGMTLSTLFDLHFPTATQAVSQLLELSTRPDCLSLKATETHIVKGFACGPGEILQKTESSLPGCYPCPPGTFMQEDVCLTCPNGTYQDQPGQVSCKRCPDGTHTIQDGATMKDFCLATCDNGMYSATGVLPCQPCPMDSYSEPNSARGYTNCTQCPLNAHTTTTGANSLLQCKEACKPGYYSITGLEPCSKCPNNFYQPARSQVTCIECPKENYTDVEGATEPNQCQEVNCAKKQCQNNAQCEVVNHVAECQCLPGYSGNLCEEKLDLCTSRPCFNGGNCVSTDSGYLCECPEGFSGERCEFMKSECQNVECLNGGICQNLAIVGETKCLCRTGFHGNRCELMVDVCEQRKEDICKNGATCMPTQLSRYSCICAPGWKGRNCDVNIDDCQEKPCAVNGICHDLINDFRCDCPPGFSGKRCEVKVDLCSDNPCVNGKCVDRNFYHQCICEAGWTGESCDQRIDECATQPCQNGATCVPGERAFQCKCALGFYGARCQHQVDHCLSKPCQNDATCSSFGMTYECKCKAGYEGVNCETTVDLCATNSPCGKGTKECVQHPEGIICLCNSGYTGRICDIAINECLNQPCFNGGTCLEDMANFTCQCMPGWTGSTCATASNACVDQPCQNQGECINLGKDYFCACKDGFDGKRCEIKIVTCTEKSCLNGGSCDDSNDQLQCHCPPGFFGDACQYERKMCTKDTCKNGGTCLENAGSVTCYCPPTFTGPHCDVDVNECASSPCSQDSICVDMVDGYACRCPSNVTGLNCDRPLDSDFDLRFYDYVLPASAAMELPFKFQSAEMAIALWVRYDQAGSEGKFLTLYASRSDRQPEQLEELIQFGSSSVKIDFERDGTPPLILNFPQQHKVNDGNWNHVVFQWDATYGIYSLYWNSVRVATAKGRVKAQNLHINAYMTLGTLSIDDGSIATRKKFVGSVSRLNLWNRTLNFESEIGPLAKSCAAAEGVRDALWPWHGFNMFNGKVERLAPSTCGVNTCQRIVDSRNCSTSNVRDRRAPSIVGCPAAFSQQTNHRQATVQWVEPTFADDTALDRVERNVIAGNAFSLGTYYIIYAAYDRSNNVAQCTFEMRLQESVCEPIDDPSNGLSYCLNWGDDSKFKACAIKCEDGYAFSTPVPNYYTCGRDGVWRIRFDNATFRYPQCAPATPSLRVVHVELDYPTTTGCTNNNRQLLESEIRKSFIALNTAWTLCASNDQRQIGCPSLNVTVECANRPPMPFTKRQVKRADLYRAYVSFVADSEPTSQRHTGDQAALMSVLKEAIMRDGQFDYSTLMANGQPDLRSFRFREKHTCPFGQVTNGNVCVACAPGSYYDANATHCQLCSVGHYQSRAGQLSCVSCSSGSTTSGPGASKRDDCKEICSPGHFYRMASGRCEPCGHGFYQPLSGAFGCQRCSQDKSTYNDTATSAEDCKDVCDDGMQLSQGGDCLPCPVATYRRKGEQDHCVACPMGKTTLAEGAIAIEQCNLPRCLEGYHLNEEKKVCTPCSKGTYQDEQMQKSCKLCPKEHTTHAEGSSKAADCYSTNQCETGEHNCHKNAICTDQPDEAFTCTCKPGYQGNGTHCRDSCIDHCMNDAVCTKQDTGEPQCQCKDTFTGDRCEVRYMPSQQRIAYITGGVGGVVGIIVVIIILVWMIYFRFRSRQRLVDSMEKLPHGGGASSDGKSVNEATGNGGPNFTYGRTLSETSQAAPNFYYEDDDDDYGTKTMYIGDGFDNADNDDKSAKKTQAEPTNEAVFQRLEKMKKHMYKAKENVDEDDGDKASTA